MTLVLLMGLIFLVSSMAIATLEGLPYVDCAFEVASAMGTVGLTTGITPELSRVSQSLLILLMEWLQRGCPESPAEIAQKAIHLFSKPLMPMIESEN